MRDRGTDLLPVLEKLRACGEALEWIRGNGAMTLAELWDTCPNGSWMLWIAARLGIDRRKVVLAACDCAETVLYLVPPGEDRPRTAIDTARAWARGEARDADAAGAAYDAYDAAAASAVAADAAADAVADAVADAAADAAAYAAASAASAAGAAGAASYAAASAASAVAADAAAADAVADAAADAARDRSRAATLKQCAALTRRHIGWRDIGAALTAERTGVA